MDLFDYMRKEEQKKESPLARRMRPETLDDIVGQEHILGEDKLLTRIIKADKLSSIILYGPPGTGKTSLAMVIANTSSAYFKEINAIATKRTRESNSDTRGIEPTPHIYARPSSLDSFCLYSSPKLGRGIPSI